MNHASSATIHLRPFGLDAVMLPCILEHATPLGHHEDAATFNLGFGFLYYGLVRSLRPRHVLVIGSGFGFSVVCMALGLRDNAAGSLIFVDPSFSVFRHGPFQTVGGQAHWDDPQKVRLHFARFGVEHVVAHGKMTSADLFARYEHLGLPPIDPAFIDGNHAYEHVAHDFMETAARSRRRVDPGALATRYQLVVSRRLAISINHACDPTLSGPGLSV